MSNRSDGARFRQVLTERFENLVEHERLIEALGMLDCEGRGEVERLTVFPVVRLVQIGWSLAERHPCGGEVDNKFDVLEIVAGVVDEDSRKWMQGSAGEFYRAVDAVAVAGPASLHFFQRVAKDRRGIVG